MRFTVRSPSVMVPAAAAGVGVALPRCLLMLCSFP
jgi:hypothetical protein